MTDDIVDQYGGLDVSTPEKMRDAVILLFRQQQALSHTLQALLHWQAGAQVTLEKLLQHANRFNDK